jgi:hypothetical protein
MISIMYAVFDNNVSSFSGYKFKDVELVHWEVRKLNKG